jgi:hypothetical protein
MPAILLAIGILANISSAGAAGPCGEVALEIAMSSKLENGGLSKDGTFISLSGNPYNAYLYCAAPGSMSLRFLGPKPPVDDWYAFVSKTSSVLTKRHQRVIRLAAELRQRSVEVESPDRNIVCRFQRSLR